MVAGVRVAEEGRSPAGAEGKNGQAPGVPSGDTASMTTNGRDRLRELLDAVLDGTDRANDGSPRRLDAMAGDAASSPYHFSRSLTRATGEPPVAMRRRVLLERAAFQLMHGASVTETAFEAGYVSVEGFSRAFARAYGRPPSEPSTGGYWLPAPNGVHFHPPTSLWVRTEEHAMDPLTEQLVVHDLDDTRELLEVGKGLTEDGFRAEVLPGNTVLAFEGEESSIAAVLRNHVSTKEIWLAAIEGHDMPPRPERADAVQLVERHDALAPRWLAMIRDLETRGAWNDRVIDALCDPPESFVVSSIVAHVLTYAAHRRQLVRRMLAIVGHPIDEGDPILWLRARGGATP